MAEQHAPPEDLLTPAEVAALVFVDPKTVSRWAKAGKIPATRTPGGHRRFRRSDVQPLIPRDSGWDRLPDESANSLFEKDNERNVMAAVGHIDRATADATIAGAVAHALEAHPDAPAEAVQESAASVTLAAETAARAAVKTRLIKAFAAAEAAQVVAGEAASAAEAMRAVAAVRAGRLAEAAAHAERLVCTSCTEAHAALDAVLVAASVQSAADAASADTALAAAGVARAASDAAAHVAMVVAAFELFLDRETAHAAEAQNMSGKTARQ